MKVAWLLLVAVGVGMCAMYSWSANPCSGPRVAGAAGAHAPCSKVERDDDDAHAERHAKKGERHGDEGMKHGNAKGGEGGVGADHSGGGKEKHKKVGRVIDEPNTHTKDNNPTQTSDPAKGKHTKHEDVDRDLKTEPVKVNPHQGGAKARPVADEPLQLKQLSPQLREAFGTSEDGRTVTLPGTGEIDLSKTKLDPHKHGLRIVPEETEVRKEIAQAEKTIEETSRVLSASSNDRFEDPSDRQRLLDAQRKAGEALRRLEGHAADVSVTDLALVREIYANNFAIQVAAQGKSGVSRSMAGISIEQGDVVRRVAQCVSNGEPNPATHVPVTVTLKTSEGKEVGGAQVYAVLRRSWEGRAYIANESAFKREKRQNQFPKPTTPTVGVLPRTQPLRIWAEQDGVEIARSQEVNLCSNPNTEIHLVIGQLPA
jgi:hypothetical protein